MYLFAQRSARDFVAGFYTNFCGNECVVEMIRDLPDSQMGRGPQTCHDHSQKNELNEVITHEFVNEAQREHSWEI
ncbi:unnamed protein product [Cercopithifilaria johnstoni]|uniref:Uncharacterized protein n=1 Tax=Cercopithifilaria johnstoni TaxID=2874296 RepID=A0A8J2M4P7_9BILA|nr:unnamed protein product [Cercopithifilaria johnstoni]